MPLNKTIKTKIYRKGGYHPFSFEYFKKKYYRRPVATMRKKDPNILQVSNNGYVVTMTKPGAKTVSVPYKPDATMNSHYDTLKAILLSEDKCLDGESYDIFEYMDKTCKKKNWIMRKANKNCRLVEKIKNKHIDKVCDPFLTQDTDYDEYLEELDRREKNEKLEEDEKWLLDKAGGKSRKHRGRKTRSSLTHRRHSRRRL